MVCFNFSHCNYLIDLLSHKGIALQPAALYFINKIQKCRLDEIFYCAALKNEIRQLKLPNMSDFVIVATLDKLIQPTSTPYAFCPDRNPYGGTEYGLRHSYFKLKYTFKTPPLALL